MRSVQFRREEMGKKGKKRLGKKIGDLKTAGLFGLSIVWIFCGPRLWDRLDSLSLTVCILQPKPASAEKRATQKMKPEEKENRKKRSKPKSTNVFKLRIWFTLPTSVSPSGCTLLLGLPYVPTYFAVFHVTTVNG